MVGVVGVVGVVVVVPVARVVGCTAVAVNGATVCAACVVGSPGAGPSGCARATGGGEGAANRIGGRMHAMGGQCVWCVCVVVCVGCDSVLCCGRCECTVKRLHQQALTLLLFLL